MMLFDTIDVAEGDRGMYTPISLNTTADELLMNGQW